MSDKGWIKLDRGVLNHWLWKDKPFSEGQAWVHLLLMANHEDKVILFNGKKVKIPRGSFITSMRKLANEWGWSKDRVSRFLTQLECDTMLDTKRDTHKTVVTIVNYGKFQNRRDTNKDNRKDSNKVQTRNIRKGRQYADATGSEEEKAKPKTREEYEAEGWNF